MSPFTSETITVGSVGPYRGLTTLPSDAKGLTAIVAGANGISGQHLLAVLLSRPDVWTNIYALSRSAPAPNTPCSDPRVNHVAIDFFSGKDAISQKLNEAGVPWGKGKIYAFYMAYKEHSKDGLWSGQKEMWEDNGKMFEGFLGALGDGVKRIILQTGGKAYGIHFGETLMPMREDQPRVEGEPYAPNFYYRQEDLLIDYCKSHPGVTWATTRPSNIIGSVAGNFMNEAITLFLYILVSLELNPGKAPAFPGTYQKYRSIEHQSSATLLGYFEEWLALSPAAENEHFNAVNGDDPMWESLWPSLLKRFGVNQEAVFGEEEIPEEWKGDTMTASVPAPIDSRLKSEISMRISLVKWSQDPKVKSAWEKVRDREGLDQKVWDGASWAFVDGVLGGQFNVVASMEKARSKGWYGTVTAEDDWAVTLEKAAHQGILPAMK